MSKPERDPKPPHIRGALVHGAAAYALSRVLSRDDIAALIDKAGLGELMRERAVLAFEAIELEAGAWRRDVKKAGHRLDPLLRGREQAGASASGKPAFPQPRPELASAAMPEETMTTRQAAEALGVTTRQIRYLITGGKLPACSVGRSYLVDAIAVAALVEERNET